MHTYKRILLVICFYLFTLPSFDHCMEMKFKKDFMVGCIIVGIIGCGVWKLHKYLLPGTTPPAPTFSLPTFSVPIPPDQTSPVQTFPVSASPAPIFPSELSSYDIVLSRKETYRSVNKSFSAKISDRSVFTVTGGAHKQTVHVFGGSTYDASACVSSDVAVYVRGGSTVKLCVYEGTVTGYACEDSTIYLTGDAKNEIQCHSGAVCIQRMPIQDQSIYDWST